MWERLAQAPDAGPPLTTNEFIGDAVVKGGAVIAFGLAQDELRRHGEPQISERRGVGSQGSRAFAATYPPQQSSRTVRSSRSAWANP